MKFEKILNNNIEMARITGEELLITDTQSALDLIATASYETQCNRIILDKESVCDDFFILSTRLAGDVLQKYINYGIKMAIIGDYSHYTSKPLHDFIYESNHGKDFFFVSTLDEAVSRLSAV